MAAVDTLPAAPDSLAVALDSLTVAPADSLSAPADSAASSALTNSSAVTEVVRYAAKDSIYLDMNTGLAHLYADASVNYQGARLEAAYMEMDMRASEVFAQPVQ
ncbi:MAG: hypothetical protein K2H62_06470, partial [Bacteroidales bacterium]|nr:hypothetical protein [Bacteroidales bacterium]